MLVKELIEELKNYPQDKEVLLVSVDLFASIDKIAYIGEWNQVWLEGEW